MRYPWQRVGVLVDVQNMYYSARALYSSYVNFGNLLRESTADRQLIRAFAYVVRADIPKQKEFFTALEATGYELRVKDLQEFPGGMKKGNWDVGIAVDAIGLSNKLDVVVLVTGDGDFVDLVEFLQNQGVLVEVAGFGRSTSGKLKEAADQFIDLERDTDKFLLKSIDRKTEVRAQKTEEAEKQHP